MSEIWKDIIDYPKYEVSSHGRVRKKGTEDIVAQVLTGEPQYYYCNLQGESKRKLVRVHRLVAQTFLPNPDNLPIVDHIDRCKTNNHIDNLRWATRKGNQRNIDGQVKLPCGRLLVEQVEEDYGEDYKLPYQTIYGHIKDKGMTYQEAKEGYDRFLIEGKTHVKTKTVEWEGETVLLSDLCDTLCCDYDQILQRLNSGYPIWNALYDCPVKHRYSVEDDTHWYPNQKYIREHARITDNRMRSLLSNGYTYTQIYEGNIPPPSTIHTIELNGRKYTGTTGEISKRTGLTKGAVQWRVNNKDPKTRIISYKINGVVKRKKAWCEEFGIDPIRCTNTMYKKQISFEEYLESVGIDTTNLKIIPMK